MTTNRKNIINAVFESKDSYYYSGDCIFTNLLAGLIHSKLHDLDELAGLIHFKLHYDDLDKVNCPAVDHPLQILEALLACYACRIPWNTGYLSLELSRRHSLSTYPRLHLSSRDHSPFNPHNPRNPSPMIFTVYGFYRHHVKPWLPSWRNTFRRGHDGHG